MEYKISQPLYLNEQGSKRSYSEDYIAPAPGQATVETRIFMVCDGVGGNVRGDLASRRVCEFFSDSVSKFIQKKKLSSEEIDYSEAGQREILNSILQRTEKELDRIVAEHPDYKGMATTLTYLHLSPKGAVIAWAGDSRVYHIRNGKILFKTEDHSLVNQLVKAGQITEEEAIHHPQKNVILRAVSGSENETSLDVKVIGFHEIKEEDIFLLCTDGILDGIDETELLQLFLNNYSDQQIIDFIDDKCDRDSNDNYSMYLVRNQRVILNTSEKGEAKKGVHTKTEQVEGTQAHLPVIDSTTGVEKRANNSFRKSLIIAIGVAIGISFLWFALSYLGIFPKVDEELTEIRDKVRNAERDLKRSSGLQDTIKALQGITADSITPEWTKKLNEDTTQLVKDLKTRLEGQQELLKSALIRESDLTTQLNKYCEDYQNVSNTLETLNDVNTQEDFKKSAETLKENFEMLCTELTGSKGNCRELCADMYTVIGADATPLSDEELEATASPVYRGIDTINETPWNRFEEIRHIGENVFKVRLPGKKKWGIYPQKKVNKRLFFFSVDPVTIKGMTTDYTFDKVYEYHNGVVKAVRGDEEFLITTGGHVIGSEDIHRYRFSWVEEQFGATCQDYAKVVLRGTFDDTVFLQKSGAIERLRPCE